MNLRKLRIRTFAIILLIVAILSGFTIHLFAQQIIRGEHYALIGSSTSGTAPIPAARGIIVDRNGIPLVYNDTRTSLVFESPFFPSRETTAGQTQRNGLLASLLDLFDEFETEWIDFLPLEIQGGVPVFLEDREADITYLRNYLNLNPYATAQNVMDALISEFDLEDFPLAVARNISSVQFNMFRLRYRTGTPYTFADEVSDELISRVLENSAFYQGVHTQKVPVRVHASGTLAPHILGRVAAITREDLDRHSESENRYRLTDEYGAFGIERVAQEYLRGTDGQKTILQDRNTGEITEIVDRPAQQGNTVVLSIDSRLQAMIEEAFPRHMADMAHRRHTNIPVAGAVVVLCTRTFEVLASVTYPTFDITNYPANYHTDPNRPIINRALTGLYEPGSTAKAGVSLAALQEEIITPSWTSRCTGSFPFGGMTFRCPQVRLHRGRPVDLRMAMVNSCNSFYYEMGRRLGYSRINAYRSMDGLAQPTGVELPEAMGSMDSPEFRQQRGQNFYAGNNLQTAIGQGNLFTPIQLAVQSATIANRGTRMNAHFIQSVRRAGTNEIVRITEPQILSQTGIERRHYDVMHEIMMDSATRAGTTAGRHFGDLPVRIAGKTGTAQVGRNIDGRWTEFTNGIFVSFAPYDNPEIAVVAVGEGGRSSEPVLPIVRDIYQFYFGSLDQMATPLRENVLL